MKTLVIALIIVHFFCDWILQSRYIARTKSSSYRSLAKHLVINFTGIFIITLFFTDKPWWNLVWLNLINIAAHGLIDWNIWTIAKRLLAGYDGDTKEYIFYSTIAVDQVLHLVILVMLFI